MSSTPAPGVTWSSWRSWGSCPGHPPSWGGVFSLRVALGPSSPDRRCGSPRCSSDKGRGRPGHTGSEKRSSVPHPPGPGTFLALAGRCHHIFLAPSVDPAQAEPGRAGPPTGTARLPQALAALGHPGHQALPVLGAERLFACSLHPIALPGGPWLPDLPGWGAG